MQKRSIAKIIASIAIIAGVGLIGIGATYAYFTDQASIPNNQVSTGNLDLSLDHSQGKPFNLVSICPGFVGNWEWVNLNNTGNIPMDAFVWLQKTGGSTVLYNQLMIQLAESGADHLCGTGDDVQIYNGPLGDLDQIHEVKTSDVYHHACGPNHDIGPGYHQTLCQRISLPSSAGNDVNNQSVTFTEWIDAEQGLCGVGCGGC